MTLLPYAKHLIDISLGQQTYRCYIEFVTAPPGAWAPAMYMTDEDRSRWILDPHKAFSEEVEWRAVCEPHFGSSGLMEHSTELVNGLPQVVRKILLDEKKSAALAELAFSNILRPLNHRPDTISCRSARGIHQGTRSRRGLGRSESGSCLNDPAADMKLRASAAT